MLLTISTQSYSGVIVTAVQENGGVSLSLDANSTLNLAGLSGPSTRYPSARIRPANAYFTLGTGVTTVYQYTASAVTRNFTGLGLGGYGYGTSDDTVFATATSGGAFGVNAGPNVASIFLPVGYVSGAVLPSAGAVFSGATFQTLGVTPGDYTWSWGSGGTADSITLRFVDVPTPATLALFGLGLAGLGWRRRKKA